MFGFCRLISPFGCVLEKNFLFLLFFSVFRSHLIYACVYLRVMMWLRSEVTEQRRRRLTARVLAQPSKVNEKPSRGNNDTSSIKRKSRRKCKSIENCSASKQKIHKNAETDSKSSRLLEKINARNTRNIRGMKLKQSLVRKRKLNEASNQKFLLKKSGWHRRNHDNLKENYYESTLLCNKKEKVITRKKIGHGLLKNIQSSKKKCKPVVSKIQRKSSFNKMSNGEHKCNINCCDKNSIMNSCSDDINRLSLVREECMNKSNIVVLSQYINPALRVNSIKSKSMVETATSTAPETALKNSLPEQSNFVNNEEEENCKIKELTNGFLLKDCLKTDECGWCHISTEAEISRPLGNFLEKKFFFFFERDLMNFVLFCFRSYQQQDIIQ